jgi:CMP-N-acetylneuraminic acid synthetase
MKKETSIDRLIEMQALCHLVEEDANKIGDFIAFIQEAEARKQKLADFYQSEWMFYYEDEKNKEAWDKELEKHVAEDSFSILDEDTIWDALQDERLEIVELLKTIAGMIE